MTRQIRLSSPEQMKGRLKQFIGKNINIVLSDRTVLFGRLKDFDERHLTFLNMRLHPATISFSDISEVYLDYSE